MKASQAAERSSIELEGVDDNGRRRSVRLNATIIAPSAAEQPSRRAPLRTGAPLQAIRKGEDEEQEAPVAHGDSIDEFTRWRGRYGLVEPPYSLLGMATMADESTELGQVISAMVTNTVGFGWQLKERRMPEASREQYAAEIEQERFELEARLSVVHATESLTMLREKEIHDKHACGNGYLELVDNQRDELVSIGHTLGQGIRVTEKQKDATLVMVPRVRPDKGFMVEEVPMWHRFRRFALVKSAKLVWFKEAGDPRQMDKRDGRYAAQGELIPFKYRATSLIHNAIYHPETVYGVPLWIGNVYSIKGSHVAEQTNFNTINRNAIPSMLIMCENGSLTQASIKRLRQWTEEQVQRAANYSTFVIIEAEPMDEGTTDPGNMRLKVEPLKRWQQTDEMFQQYDQNNRDKIRQCFRLPPIFVGRSDDYTRATADASRDLADEQVFAPERSHNDWLINRFILPRWGAKYHVFVSRTPNITSDIELIRLMAIAERSGAMTPRRSDRIIRDVFGDGIGPLPKGIDLDKPYSLTFAEAQKGGGTAGIGAGMDTGPAGDVTRGLIGNLMDLRQRIEKELDRRFDGDEEV